MKYQKITVYTEHTEEASAALILLGAEGTEVISPGDDDLASFQIDFKDLPDTLRTSVSTCFSFVSEEEGILQTAHGSLALSELLQTLRQLGYDRTEVSIADSADWEEEWKKYLVPTELSRFVLIPLVEGYPESEERENTDSRERIYILPGRAFGTGLHETTRLCVELLGKYVRKGGTVADIGTGSGILAIAAKKLGAARVYAVDNDPGALENMRVNADLNHAEIEISCADLASEITGAVDLVVANIIAKAVMELGGSIRSLLVKNGMYLCSGILTTQRLQVADALREQGYEIIEEADLGEWSAIAARWCG